MTSTLHHRSPADERFSLRISKHCHEQLTAQYGSIAPGIREAMAYLRDNGLEDLSDVDGFDGSDLDGQASKRVTIRVQPTSSRPSMISSRTPTAAAPAPSATPFAPATV